MTGSRLTGSQPLTTEILERYPIPGAADQGDKEQRGRVLVISGSVEIPGAAILAGTAVLRSGAGKLQLAVPATIATSIGVALPEARVFGMQETSAGDITGGNAKTLVERAQHCSSVLIGPGMFDKAETAELCQALLGGVPQTGFVLDAAALSAAAKCEPQLRAHQGGVVLTPHPGEMAGMLDADIGEVEADPVGISRKAAQLFHAVVALKSARTHIAFPSGEVFHLDAGKIGLATAGSGDTLSGIAAGLLGRGASAQAAALWAVHLHREAGVRLCSRIGPIGYLAHELLAEIPRVLASDAPR